MLVVISGLPGTGKSAVAAAVADHLGAVRLSIDDIEEALLGAGLPRSWTTGVAAYEAARAVAELNLTLGRTVVVDAVNDSQAARDTWRDGSARTGARLVFVLLTLDDPVEHRRRLEERVRDFANIDEPSWNQVLTRAAASEPWVGDYIAINTSRTIAQVSAAIVNELQA